MPHVLHRPLARQHHRTWGQALKLLAALLLAAAASGCEATEGGTDGGLLPGDGSTIQPDAQPDAARPPEGIAIFRKAGEEAEVAFDNGDEAFLVVPYSVSSAAADAIDFTITVTGAGEASSRSSQLLVLPPRRPLWERDPQLWQRWQQRLAVERWTRQLAEQAARTPLRQRPGALDRPLAACTLSSECEADAVCFEGNCAKSVSIKVEAFSSTAAIDTEVARKGQRSAILVDTAATVSGDDLDAVLAMFEETILPRALALFGAAPLRDGESRPAYDRNGDGLVWLVLTRRVEEKQAVGFFVATDFGDEAGSNKADILYAIPPDATNTPDKVFPILAHELQHLLSYASKVYRPKVGGGEGALEALWLDEGLAHFAEDACGFGGENVTILDEQLFPVFGETSLFSQQDSMAMRALALTFVRHLFEQKGGVSYDAATKDSPGPADRGGAAWLQAVHRSAKIGAEAIDATYGDHKQAFDNWVAAVALDGRGVTDFAGWSYAPLVDDPVTGNKIGLAIRGERPDATGKTIQLQGPLEEALTGDSTEETIPNAAARFFLLSGRSGAVKVSVTTQESDFRFAVIKAR